MIDYWGKKGGEMIDYDKASLMFKLVCIMESYSLEGRLLKELESWGKEIEEADENKDMVK